MRPDPSWLPARTEEVLRRRPVRRLTEPLRERRFTYAHYDRFLARLVSRPDLRVVPLRELTVRLTEPVATIGLRHDVDDRLPSALRLAELEHARGLRATYFILHTARYYGGLGRGDAEHEDSVVPSLRRLQELGHEVGWHNDLVTLQLVYGVDPVGYAREELAWLRENGIDVVGTSAHGSIHCHRLGFHNNEFFLDWPTPVPGAQPSRSHVVVDGESRALRRALLADLGFAYEAYHLDVDRYCSDATFDGRGRRWHPELLDLDAIAPGERAVVLVHPCHWDTSVAAKAVRVGARLVRRSLGHSGAPA